MDEKKWTSKDWKWTIGILIGIIILIVSLWIGDDKVSVNVSIASSGFSIALALVAIFISLKQDSDTGRLNNQMNSTLSRMDGKLDTVEQKVNQIDLGLIKEVLQQKLDENFTLGENEVNTEKMSKQEINKLLEKQKNEMSNDINNLIEDIDNMNKEIAKNLGAKSSYGFEVKNPTEIRKIYKNKESFRIGDRVNHRKWGAGTIIWIDALAGKDAQEAVIEFDDQLVGKKKLLVSFSPITKIKNGKE